MGVKDASGHGVGGIIVGMLEIYVDDYISLAIPRTKADRRHVANAIMKGVHDVFPADDVDENDPLSYKNYSSLRACGP